MCGESLPALIRQIQGPELGCFIGASPRWLSPVSQRVTDSDAWHQSQVDRMLHCFPLHRKYSGSLFPSGRNRALSSIDDDGQCLPGARLDARESSNQIPRRLACLHRNDNILSAAQHPWHHRITKAQQQTYCFSTSIRRLQGSPAGSQTCSS